MFIESHFGIFITLEYQTKFNENCNGRNDNDFTKMVKYCQDNGPEFGDKLIRYENVDINILFCFLNLSMTTTATVKFKERMTYEKFSDAVTVFEEAFAILILENSLNRWIYMAERQKRKLLRSAGKESEDSSSTSDDVTDNSDDNDLGEIPDVLYQAKIRKRNDNIDTAGKWTEDGMKRLNALITMAQEGRNRTTRDEFETLLQNKYIQYADSNVEMRLRNKRKRELDEMNAMSNKGVVVKNVLNFVAL